MDLCGGTACSTAILKDRGATKCVIGLAVFLSVACIILYFSMQTSCSEPRPITDFTALSWRHSPRRVKLCNTSDTEFAEISAFEFYTVEVTGICYIECRGEKQFQATCPFYMQDLKFVINGTSFIICGRVDLHLRWELNADDVTAKIIGIGNNPDTFMTHRECIKGKEQKNSTENENLTEIRLDQFSSILAQIYLLGGTKYIQSSNSETVLTETTVHSQNSTDHNKNSRFSADNTPKYCKYNNLRTF